jgi:S13-like H2TH domain
VPPSFERRAFAGGVKAGGEPGVRVVSARISSPAQDSLDQHRATPKRSLDQRMDALRKANEVRARRARLKRDLNAGRVSICALLLEQPGYLETAKVFEMLLALPKIGRVKATKILQSCRVSPSKTFGGLSERQRAELAGHLHRYFRL